MRHRFKKLCLGAMHSSGEHPLHGKTRNYDLADTMRLIKGSTSREINKLLNRNGHLWHHESYNHFVRNQEEFDRIIAYILANPVKAGLAKNEKEWPFSSCNTTFMS